MKKLFNKDGFIPKAWRLVRPFKADMLRILLVTVLFETIRLGGPYLFSKILDLLIKSNGIISFQTVVGVVLGLAGVRILSLIIDYVTDFIIINMLIKLETNLSTRAFAKLLELSLDYHEKVNTGTKINIVNKGVDKFVNLIESYSFEFQPVVLQLLISAIWLISTNWKIGLLFTLSIFPFVYITFKTYQSTAKLRSDRHDAYDLSSGEIGDIVTNITVVKAFAQEHRENRNFNSIWDSIRNISITEVKRHLFAGFGRSNLIELFYMISLVIGMMEIRAGHLTVGGLVFLINLIERGYSNTYRLGRIYERVVDATEYVDRLNNLFEQESSIKNSQNPVRVRELKGSIHFKNVNFSYGKKNVLKNVSFTIPEGSFTAFVGKSGSGKSTIAKLLSRYYDPTGGGIIIDGKYDLRDLDIDTYRANTAVVFQDSPVPDRKIWEVISYSAGRKKWHIVRDKVIRAAKLAHAHEFINDLDEGYHTVIGERGVKLSGGQKQRLAIARALFAEPKILIMDEPTSHLDTLSESLIQKALEDISCERSLTKIVIAHRLSTVQNADQILVMEKGRLVEQGTHSELLKKNGPYAAIVHQSELRA